MMNDELKRNPEQIKLNLERIKNKVDSIITQEHFTQEHFEDLFFEGWNRGSKETYVKENGRWIKND